MTHNPNHQVPPGMEARKEKGFFLLSLLAVTVLSIWMFLSHYLHARENLFVNVGGKRMAVLLPDAVMTPLSDLFSKVFDPLFLLILCIPFWILLHYLSYRKGSMSIYLMRRLPDRTLLHRQCLTLPILALVITLAALLILTLIYHLIYIYATPAVCLPAAYRRYVL